jgi:hypothetical protein
MAWTQDDLNAVRAARLELAKGQRVVTVKFADGSSVEYANTSIGVLQSLEQEIAAEVNDAAGAANYFVTSTSKGL